MEPPRIEPCPTAGSGVNDWLYITAIKLAKHLSAQEIERFLCDGVKGCGRTVESKEIRRQIERGIGWADNAINVRWTHSGHVERSFASKLRDTRLDISTINGILDYARGFEVADLYELSPVRNVALSEEIIRGLFPGSPWLCCGWSQSRFLCRPREFWHGRWRKLQLIVPTPQMQQFGLNTDGKQSEHALSNCLDRRFIITEFDQGTVDSQAAIIWHLQAFAPLCLVVYSGKKSLHAWFYCQGMREEKLQNFFEYAVKLGADFAHWNRSQFTRVPGGSREGVEQSTYYFNPEFVEKFDER